MFLSVCLSLWDLSDVSNNSKAHACQYMLKKYCFGHSYSRIYLSSAEDREMHKKTWDLKMCLDPETRDDKHHCAFEKDIYGTSTLKDALVESLI